MKKFVCGFLAGAIIFGATGAAAVSYIAQPASFKVFVNGEEFTSEPPALVVDGRTYLPLRAIGDALGVPVNWNEELRRAEVGSSAEDINKAINIEGSVSVDGFTFSQLSVKNNSGMYFCDVEVSNNSGKDVEFIMFSISFFDSNGTRVGVADLGSVSNGLKNGETKTASLFSSDDLAKAKTARYEISNVH